MNDEGSGRRSRQAWQARMLRSRPGCRRLSEQDGSERQAACHQRCSGPRRSRSPGGISRFRSGRRLRFFACRAIPCRRSGAGSAGQRRRSPVNCGATPPREAAAWSIAQRPRSGMPSDRLVVRSGRSLPSMRPCEPMWRTDWLASSSLQAEFLFPARPYPGRVVGTGGGRIDDGPEHGARSRSPAACRSTFRTTRRCASAMKPSIRHCSSKAEGRCVAN